MSAQMIGLAKYTGDGQTAFERACDAREAAIYNNPDELDRYRRRFVESAEPVTLRDDCGNLCTVTGEAVFAAYVSLQVERECRK